jgi:hypothetical protein
MMKQEITQEQYDSLSNQGRQKYLAWVFEKQSINKDYHVAYRSIQHLIQFIDDHIKDEWWHIERETDKTGWRIQSRYIDFDEDDATELVDALWDAVKVLLENYDIY